MGIGTKIKEIITDEPHGKDQVPGSYPDESKGKQNYSSSQGVGAGQSSNAAGTTGTAPATKMAGNTGTIPAAAAAGGVGGAGLGGMAATSGQGGPHGGDSRRGLTDSRDHAAPMRGDSAGVGSTTAPQGAPAAGSAPVYGEKAQPGGVGAGGDYGNPPAPIAFGQGNSGQVAGAGSQQPTGMAQGQAGQSRQTASTTQNGSAGPALAGVGAGVLGGAGATAGLAHLGRETDVPSAGNKYDDPSVARSAGLQNQNQGLGGAAPQTAPTGTLGGQTGAAAGSKSYPTEVGNQNGHARSGGGLAAGSAGAGAAAGGAAGAGAGAAGSGLGSGSETDRNYYGPGHEGATVIHKCESCGADNDISRYFNKSTVYRMAG